MHLVPGQPGRSGQPGTDLRPGQSGQIRHSQPQARQLPPAPSRRGRSATRLLVAALTLATLGVVTVGVDATVGLPGRSELLARASGLPRPPADARDSRVLPAVIVPDTPGRYAYLQTKPDGSPVTYDPCRPIHYVINPAGAPQGGEQAVHDALQRLSAVTGLAFVHDGTSTQVPLSGRPDRGADGWAPVLIGWGDERSNPQLAGGVAGLGGSVALSPDGPASARYVTGEVLLDADAMRGFGTVRGHLDQESVALHELAHVLGMAHVPADSELMSPTYIGIREFGPGDRAGLARLGQGVCHTDT